MLSNMLEVGDGVSTTVMFVRSGNCHLILTLVFSSSLSANRLAACCSDEIAMAALSLDSISLILSNR